MYIKGDLGLYALKSKRKNSKCDYKVKQIIGGSSNMKEFYTKEDIWDFMGFMINSQFRNFNIVAYSNSSCVFTINNFYPMGDIESVINRLYDVMRILNFREWDFTKEDLHNDPNTRYLINQFYHPDKK